MKHDLYGRKPQYNGSVQKEFSITDIVDNDTVLIFAMIFLLRLERRNPILILALLYILT